MKFHQKNIQLRVLQRLEAGLHPTRWQQLILHLQTMTRQLRRKRFSTLWFHGKGIARLVWKPFTICRLAGVPVQFHITWLIFPAGFLFWLLFDSDRPWTLYCALLLLLSLFVSELTHELAHVFAARRFGIPTRRILFFPLGAFAELESGLDKPNEFWIALAGPLASLALAGIFQVSYHTMCLWSETWDKIWLYHLMRNFELCSTLNLFLAFFNLLPCFPMDGGRIMRSSLAVLVRRLFPRHANKSFLTATMITVRFASWPVALGMMIYAIFNLEYFSYLILFPLLLFLAEIEYWGLRTDDNANEKETQIEFPFTMAKECRAR